MEVELAAVAAKWAVVVAVVLPSVQAGKSQLVAVRTYLSAVDIELSR